MSEADGLDQAKVKLKAGYFIHAGGGTAGGADWAECPGGLYSDANCKQGDDGRPGHPTQGSIHQTAGKNDDESAQAGGRTGAHAQIDGAGRRSPTSCPITVRQKSHANGSAMTAIVGREWNDGDQNNSNNWDDNDRDQPIPPL